MTRRFRYLPAWAKALLWVFATAALYAVTARIGLGLAMPPEKKATAVWLPSGIALAALLLGGRQVWAGVWLGAFLANLWDAFISTSNASFNSHLVVSTSIATGSTLQAVLGRALLRDRFEGDRLLNCARGSVRFFFAAPLMCLVGATVGVTALALVGFTPWAQYGSSWWTWWLGDTVGVLLVTPLFLNWTSIRHPGWSPRRLVEGSLLAGLMLGVGILAFGGWSPSSVVTETLTYSIVPLLVCAAFRFDQAGAVIGLAMVSGIAIWGTVQGHGPFVGHPLHESLLLLQTFIGVLAVTVLTLTGALAERQQADRAKAFLIEHLEDALNEIKTIRGLIPICAWCKSIRNDQGGWEQLEAYLQDHTKAEISHGICPECARKRIDQLAR